MLETFVRLQVPAQVVWWHAPEYSPVRKVEWDKLIAPDLITYMKEANKERHLLDYHIVDQYLPTEKTPEFNT